MADQEAQQLVQALLAQGLSASAISRAIGRDRRGGGISQIARGARSAGYGRSFVAALQQLAEEVQQRSSEAESPRQVAERIAGSQPISPPRRRTSAGDVARVRVSTAREHQAGPGAWSLRGGRTVSHDGAYLKPGAKTQAAAVRNKVHASPGDTVISVKLHGRAVGGDLAQIRLPELSAAALDQLLTFGTAADDPVGFIEPADPANSAKSRKRTTLNVLTDLADRYATLAGVTFETTTAPVTFKEVYGFEVWGTEADDAGEDFDEEWSFDFEE